MRPDFMLLLKKLMHADQIDVSYFAAGIIAHLASDGSEAWLVSTTDREEILVELVSLRKQPAVYFRIRDLWHVLFVYFSKCPSNLYYT